MVRSGLSGAHCGSETGPREFTSDSMWRYETLRAER
jgi:hypothetical protein